MKLKNAATVFLVAFLATSIVMLIVRLTETPTPTVTEENQFDNGLMVYYFHSNVRCPTCESIEKQAYITVHKNFAPELYSKAIGWKILNYQEPQNVDLAKQFDLQMPVVVLAEMHNGEIVDSQRLDQVWALYTDEPAFEQYIKSSISGMLAREGANHSAPTSETKSETGENAAETDEDISIPVDLPLPGTASPQEETVEIDINGNGALPLPTESQPDN